MSYQEQKERLEQDIKYAVSDEMRAKAERMLAALVTINEGRQGVNTPPTYSQLIDLVSDEMLAKLLKNEQKRAAAGLSSQWWQDGWQADCTADLRKHVDKGDPVDVIILAAFHLFHGWSTKSDAWIDRNDRLPEDIKGSVIAWHVGSLRAANPIYAHAMMIDAALFIAMPNTYSHWQPAPAAPHLPDVPSFVPGAKPEVASLNCTTCPNRWEDVCCIKGY